MNSPIATFAVQLPVNDELLTVTLLMFGGKPGRNPEKNYSYSIVGRASGMHFRSLEVQIVANYGKGVILSEEPVIKNSQFVFSNKCCRPAGLKIKLNAKAHNKAGNMVAALFIIEIKYTLQKFMVSAAQVRHTLGTGAILPSPDSYINHLLAAR